MIITRSKALVFTRHAQAKMAFYKLSESRVRHVLHSPKRIEDGVAPKTIAMMQPGSIKKVGQKESWSQEIWIMFQDSLKERKIISAWRYPGVTKVRSGIMRKMIEQETQEYEKAAAPGRGRMRRPIG
jgi:hypothetical protein